VGIDKGPETGVRLGIRDLPRETAEDHAHEDDGNTPNVSLTWVIVFLREDFWGQIRVGAHDTGRPLLSLSRIVKDGCGAKVDELDNVIRGHDAIIEFEIAMCQSHLVQILDTVADLSEHTINLWATHLAGHDDTKEVVWGIFHDL